MKQFKNGKWLISATLMAFALQLGPMTRVAMAEDGNSSGGGGGDDVAKNISVQRSDWKSLRKLSDEERNTLLAEQEEFLAPIRKMIPDLANDLAELLTSKRSRIYGTQDAIKDQDEGNINQMDTKTRAYQDFYHLRIDEALLSATDTKGVQKRKDYIQHEMIRRMAIMLNRKDPSKSVIKTIQMDQLWNSLTERPLQDAADLRDEAAYLGFARYMTKQESIDLKKAQINLEIKDLNFDKDLFQAVCVAGRRDGETLQNILKSYDPMVDEFSLGTILRRTSIEEVKKLVNFSKNYQTLKNLNGSKESIALINTQFPNVDCIAFGKGIDAIKQDLKRKEDQLRLDDLSAQARLVSRAVASLAPAKSGYPISVSDRVSKDVANERIAESGQEDMPHLGSANQAR